MRDTVYSYFDVDENEDNDSHEDQVEYNEQDESIDSR